MTPATGSPAVETALRERVKELTCLYEVAQLASRSELPLERVLEGIAEIARRAWQYPESASVRISVDGQVCQTAAFREGREKQSAYIVAAGVRRGSIEVVYAERLPEADEGPFLKEERRLLDTLAAEIGSILRRREVEQEKTNLQEQLRHADRLATIGQLAAGVAHELNEPLGNILGFAQLAEKSAGLSEQTRADLQKITAAALRGREIVKKLLVFARQSPPNKTRLDLNQLVEEGLRLFQSRSARQGVTLEFLPARALPRIAADGAQLTQVLVNLVVNALQAMPDGGRLTVRTRALDDHVALIVEDTGSGMSQDTIAKLFVPFFTTKDVGEGTGLGLPVVHGIVTSHGGRLEVESSPGQGARFAIELPVRQE